VARLAARGGRHGSAFWTDSAANQLRLAAQLALRGHLREAYATAGTRFRAVFGDLAVLGVVPADTAAAEFARWKAYVVLQSGFKVKAIRCDNASEYKAMKGLILAPQGIGLELIVVYSPW